MIHPTAIIDPSATLAADVEVGPYAIIESGVVLGPGCRVEAHGQVLAGVVMGPGNTVGRAAIIGGEPQALGFDRSIRSGVRIGEGNIFREHVTIHRSLLPDHFTSIGDRNFLMAGAHLGHDVVLGNDNVLANAVLVAGHVTIGDRCFLGGSSVFHQFIRVGDMVMVQGNSSLSQDIPPYCTACLLNRVESLNIVGLRRAGFDGPARLEIKRAFTAVYFSVMGPVKAAAQALEAESWSPRAMKFLEFFTHPGPKGIAGR